MNEKPKDERKDGGTRCAAWEQQYCDISKLKDKVGVFESPNPKKEPERHEFWCTVVKRTRYDFVFKKGTSRLCGAHFDDDQIENLMRIRITALTNPKLGKT